jgi:hypothetical protein
MLPKQQLQKDNPDSHTNHLNLCYGTHIHNKKVQNKMIVDPAFVLIHAPMKIDSPIKENLGQKTSSHEILTHPLPAQFFL